MESYLFLSSSKKKKKRLSYYNMKHGSSANLGIQRGKNAEPGRAMEKIV